MSRPEGLAPPRPGMLRQVIDNNVGQVLGQVASVVRLFVLAYLLGPEPLGLWSILMLIITYGVNGQLGLFDGMNQLVPFLRGAGSTSAERIKDSAFTTTLLVTGALAIVIGLGGWFLTPNATMEARLGIVAMAVTLVLYQIVNFQMALPRFQHRFDIVRNATVLRSLSDLVVSIGLASSLGLSALFLGLVVSHLLTIGYLAWHRVDHYRFVLDGPSLRQLFGTGFPILLSGLAFTLMTSIDRLLLAHYGIAADLGYYSIGSQLGSFVFFVPAFTASVLYMHFLHNYGKSGKDIEALRGSFESTMLVFATAIPLLAIGLAAASGLLGLALPQFSPGLSAIRLVVIASGFLALATVANNLLVTVGRTRSAIAVQLGAAAICAVIGSLLLRRGWGPEGAAWGAIAAYGTYATAILVVAAKLFSTSWKGSAKRVLAWYAPFATMLLVDVVFVRSVGMAHTPTSLVVWTALRGVLLLAAATPFILHLERRTGLTRRLLGRRTSGGAT